jgi:hypothetical protein
MGQDPGPGDSAEASLREQQRANVRLRLDHIGHLDAMIPMLDAQIEAVTMPFRAQRDPLGAIPSCMTTQACCHRERRPATSRERTGFTRAG